MLKQELPSSKERLFICPCAKSYFSYAALFTHIKQKHDGKAPGPIVKPKAENKRGRPRKQPLPNSSFSTFQQPRKSPSSGTNDTGQQNRFNSSLDLNQKMSDLKCTPSSKFTLYKRDTLQLSTGHSLSEQPFQEQILKDLSRYLEINSLAMVPFELISKIQASQYLISEEYSQVVTIRYLQRFLYVCRYGLKPETYSQLLLLLAMLLQHITEQQGIGAIDEISLSCVHKHIVSFFEYINLTSREMDLTPFSIFNDLNTIKSLIVFFNWLSKNEQSQLIKHEDESYGGVQ